MLGRKEGGCKVTSMAEGREKKKSKKLLSKFIPIPGKIVKNVFVHF